MKKLGSILRLDFVPFSVDVGLLVLRLWLGLSLLLMHGWDKLSHFQKMAGNFPDPLHIHHRNSLILAVIGEAVCPILIVLGLFTRLGALGSAINMSVAFFLVHNHSLKVGELAFVYLCGFVVLLLSGGGRFSMDAKAGSGSAPKRPKVTRD